jgi:SAM-dependent methyltransferase
MKLLDIVNRDPEPLPWREGDNIPWNDPGFSQRMLREHLTQDHDHASRKTEKIDQHVQWIHQELLAAQSGRILDLGCGPGLYTSRLAALGHTCTGIDFSPASVEYARAQNSPRCTYHEGDLRSADFGQGYHLAMLIFGEFNVFRTGEARSILQKAFASLLNDGILLLEPQPYAAVMDQGQEAQSWYSTKGGLFSDDPHLVLTESHWDQDKQAATQRYYIIKAEDGCVERYAASYRAYTHEEYTDLLVECGFEDVRFFPALGRSHGDPDPALIALTARKQKNLI